MRKLSVEFLTKFISERGSQSKNRDYFGFVELDDFACYAIAEGYDHMESPISAKLAVDTVLELFVNKPTISGQKLKKYIQQAHKNLVQQSINFHLTASILVIATDYSHARIALCGNCHVNIFRANGTIYKSHGQSLFWHRVKQGRIPEDGTEGLEESRNLLSYLGIKGLLDIEVSKRIALLAEDVILTSTWGFWVKVNATEMLDALEEVKEPQQYLDELHELYLSKQEGNLQNHTMATVFINKTFANQEKHKKYRKIIIIASIVTLIIVITLIIVSYILYSRRVETVSTVVRHITQGDIYVEEENYERAITDYNNAKEESKKLTRRMGKNGRANTDIKAIIDNRYRVAALVADGNDFFEAEQYADARKHYTRAMQAAEVEIQLISKHGYLFYTDEQEKGLLIKNRFFFNSYAAEIMVNVQDDSEFIKEKIDLCDYLEMEQKLATLVSSGDDLLKDKQYDRAIKNYEDAIKTAEAYTAYQSYLFDGLFIEGIKAKIVLSQDSQKIEDLIILGDLQANLKLYEMALDTYTDARSFALKNRDADSLNSIAFSMSQVESILKQIEDESAVKVETAKKEEQDKLLDAAILAERLALQAEAIGAYNTAIVYYQEAINYYMQAGDRIAVIDTEMKCTNVYALIDQQNIKTQLTLSLEVLRKGDDYIAKARKELDTQFIDLAIERYWESYDSFIGLNEPEEAIKAINKIEQTKEVRREIETTLAAAEAEALEKNGDDLFSHGEYEAALLTYRDALRLYLNIKEKESIQDSIEKLTEKIDYTEGIINTPDVFFFGEIEEPAQ